MTKDERTSWIIRIVGQYRAGFLAQGALHGYIAGMRLAALIADQDYGESVGNITAVALELEEQCR